MTRIQFFNLGQDSLPKFILQKLQKHLHSRKRATIHCKDLSIEQKLAPYFADLPLNYIVEGETPAHGDYELLINLCPTAPRQFGQFEEIWEIIGTDVDSGREKYQLYKARGYTLTVANFNHEHSKQSASHSE